MTTAHRILESIGSEVASTLNVGQPRNVTGLHMHGDESPTNGDGAIVVATAAQSAQAQRRVIIDAAQHGAAGVVMRGPIDDIVEQAADVDLTLGALADGIGWVEFITMTDTMIRQVSSPAEDTANTHEHVFQLADEVAELLRAPVTVEDVRSQVLAYAAYEEIADEARIGSILGRAVPREIVRELRATGTFRRLAVSHEPFVVDIEDPGFLTRLVVPLRVGPELVGSIWAIYSGELTRSEQERLRDLAHSLAVLLIRLRAHDELANRYGPDRVREAFRRTTDGPPGDPLTLPAPCVRVMAMSRLDGTSPRDDLALWRAIFRRHGWADPVLADVDGVVFGIVADGDGPGSWTWARDLTAKGHVGPVGASRSTRSAGDLPARNREALEVLRAAVDHGHVAVSHEDVWSQIVLRRTLSAVPRDVVRGLSTLESRGRGPDKLADTLLTWLMSWGDYNQAARRLGLHPNTVRQRLHRIEPLLEDIELSDPDQRLAATLVLRAHLTTEAGPALPADT